MTMTRVYLLGATLFIVVPCFMNTTPDVLWAGITQTSPASVWPVSSISRVQVATAPYVHRASVIHKRD